MFQTFRLLSGTISPVRASALLTLVLGSLALAEPAAAQVVPLFTYSPPQPQTGETITFTATVGGSITWDFDDDGNCNDAGGAVATHAFQSAGVHSVRICVDGDATIQRQDITVLNRSPSAAFTIVPAQPVAREPVVLTSTSVDPDGPIVAQQWDLDGDGAFDDAAGETAQYFWRRAGTYPVGLLVTDRDGANAVTHASVVVAPRPAGQLSFTPLVRFAGEATRTGAQLELVTVTAPKGANVGVRCKGRNCPYKRKRFTSKGKRVNLNALERSYRAGTQIEIRVTKPETIGHFTRYRIRAGNRPLRVDRCLLPGKPNDPVGCDIE
jgi:PKD repeat protein